MESIAINNHIVADCDEILVNISPVIVGLMHHKESGNYEYYNKYFRLATDENFSAVENEERILFRPVFGLDEWLIRPGIIDELGEDEVQSAIDKLINELVFHPNLYDHLQPTRVGLSLAETVKTGMVDRISIVTRTNDKNLHSKEKFLKKLFAGSMKKVDIYYVDPWEKKSDVISGLAGELSVYYEDEISNIEDVVMNCDNVRNMSIMIPSFGYNAEFSPELLDKCKEKNIELRTYNYR